MDFTNDNMMMMPEQHDSNSLFTIKSEWFATEANCGVQQVADLTSEKLFLESDDELTFAMSTTPPALTALDHFQPQQMYQATTTTVNDNDCFLTDDMSFNLGDFNLADDNNNLANLAPNGDFDFLPFDVFTNAPSTATTTNINNSIDLNLDNSPTFSIDSCPTPNSFGFARSNNNNFAPINNMSGNFTNNNIGQQQQWTHQPQTQNEQRLVLELEDVREVWYRRKNFPKFTIRLRLANNSTEEFPIPFEPVAVRLCARRADGTLLTDDESNKLFTQQTVILLLPRVHPTLGKVLEGKVERFKFAQSTRSFGGHINFQAVPTDAALLPLVRSETRTVSIKSSKPKDFDTSS